MVEYVEVVGFSNYAESWETIIYPRKTIDSYNHIVGRNLKNEEQPTQLVFSDKGKSCWPRVFVLERIPWVQHARVG